MEDKESPVNFVTRSGGHEKNWKPAFLIAGEARRAVRIEPHARTTVGAAVGAGVATADSVRHVRLLRPSDC